MKRLIKTKISLFTNPVTGFILLILFIAGILAFRDVFVYRLALTIIQCILSFQAYVFFRAEAEERYTTILLSVAVLLNLIFCFLNRAVNYIILVLLTLLFAGEVWRKGKGRKRSDIGFLLFLTVVTIGLFITELPEIYQK